MRYFTNRTLCCFLQTWSITGDVCVYKKDKLSGISILFSKKCVFGCRQLYHKKSCSTIPCGCCAVPWLLWLLWFDLTVFRTAKSLYKQRIVRALFTRKLYPFWYHSYHNHHRPAQLSHYPVDYAFLMRFCLYCTARLKIHHDCVEK